MRAVFVCTGNTCRSPMLKFMAESYFKARKIDVETDSAGIIRQTAPMNPLAAQTLDKHGVAYENYISKFCDQSVISDADIVIALSDEALRFLKENYGGFSNIVSFEKITGSDVSDPYGQGIEAYENVYRLFEKLLPEICEYIRKQTF